MPDEERPAASLRARSFLLGAALIPLVSFWVAGMENVYGGRPTYLSVFFHAVILLAVLYGVNRLLRLIAPKLAFTRGELLLIYIMIGVSSGIVGDQFMAILVPSLAHPFRYASEANQWAETLLPYMPAHATVSDPVAVRNFYEGDASLYDPRNYGPWLAPGLLWAAFIATTQLMCLAVNVIIRRQWTEYEKLSFPLTILPLEMTLRGHESIWRDRLMWIGFGIAALIGIINGLHVHFPAVPQIPVKNQWIRVSPRWRGPMASLGVAFYPFIIGLGYLLPLELTFSIWFFVLLLRAERIAFSALGYPSRPIWTSAGSARPPAILEQSIGAYIAVVYWGFATAREHLSRVWRAVVTGRPPGDGRRAMTPAEVTEYRAAFLTLGAGLFLTAWFGSTLGMPAWIAAAYLALYLVITTAITKIRAEAGAPSHGFHFAGPDHILLAALGTERIGPREFPAWGLFFGFNRGYTGVPQPHQLEGMKMGEMLQMDDQRLDAGMALATILGSIAGVWALLHLCFREGVELM
ncbi:MAG: DUF6785 family protein, partial [Armatimonadota bacterium]